jgi:hypothetical protein
MQVRHVLTTALTATLGVSVAAPAFAWTPLAPNSATGINVLSEDASCSALLSRSTINAGDITGISSITSAVIYNKEGSPVSSCLTFDPTNANVYGNTTSEDVGTSDLGGGLWYRPAARNAVDEWEERGRLEYGTYTFDLDDEYSSRGGTLLFRFLDTEWGWKQTGVTIDGVFHNAFNDEFGWSGDDYQNINYNPVKKLPKGGDDYIVELELDMADIFQISLGSDTGGTGDGVNFQVFARFNDIEDDVSVPEPSLLLGMVGLVGGLMKIRRQTA